MINMKTSALNIYINPKVFDCYIEETNRNTNSFNLLLDLIPIEIENEA